MSPPAVLAALASQNCLRKRSYASMPYRSRGSEEDDRTPEEKATFRKALKVRSPQSCRAADFRVDSRRHATPSLLCLAQFINGWFSHPLTNVCMLDTPLPTGKEYTNTRPYESRGWCYMEILVARIVKREQCLISVSKLGGIEKTMSEVRLKGKEGRGAPVHPAAMARVLQDGVARGSLVFVNRADVKEVAELYRETFAAEMAAITRLVLNQLNLGDSAIDTLAQSIRAAHAGGGLRKLTGLYLDDNAIGDVGLAKLLTAFEEEAACPNLVELGLDGNALTHEGVHALVVALSRGALPSCERIDLHGAPGAQLVADALAARARGGSPGSVEAVVRRAKEAAQSAAVAREVELAKVGLPSQILARYRDGGGSTCSFWFLHAEKIRTSDATTLPNLQKLRKTHAEWLVQKEITFAEGFRGAYKKTFLAVSHRWEKPGEPDTLGVQFAAIRKHLVDHPEIQFVWYDVRCFLCAAQDWLPLPTLSTPQLCLICRSTGRCRKGASRRRWSASSSSSCCPTLTCFTSSRAFRSYWCAHPLPSLLPWAARGRPHLPCACATGPDIHGAILGPV